MSRYLQIVHKLMSKIDLDTQKLQSVNTNIHSLIRYLNNKQPKKPLESPGKGIWWNTTLSGKISTTIEWESLPLQQFNFNTYQSGIERIYYICFKRNSKGQTLYGATIWKRDSLTEMPNHERNYQTAKKRFELRPIPTIIDCNRDFPAARTRQQTNSIITITGKVEKQFIKACCKYGVRWGSSFVYYHQLRQRVCLEIKKMLRYRCEIETSYGKMLSIHERNLKISKNTTISMDDYLIKRKMELKKLKILF